MEPDAQKNRALAIEAVNATAGVPVVFTLEEVTNQAKIEKFNLPEMPAIIIDGEVKTAGKYLDQKEFRELFKDILNKKTTLH